MRIGVLALQGGFAEHIRTLGHLNVECVQIRKPSDLDSTIDALIIPGGESTVISRLLIQTGLFEPIKNLLKHGLPAFGTCAGMIVLSSHDQSGFFGSLAIEVSRNAYGRQLGSFKTTEHFTGIGMVPMTFIRAPIISWADPEVTILATVDGKAVAARQNNVLVTSFHPELTDDLRIHRYFLQMIETYKVVSSY